MTETIVEASEVIREALKNNNTSFKTEEEKEKFLEEIKLKDMYLTKKEEE